MRLSRIEIRHFRNLGCQELEVPPEGMAVVGANAQGKSNLLEAIYYLETFRSFRGARDDQLVAFGQEAFHLRAVLGADGAPDVDDVARRGAEPGLDDRRPEITAAFQTSGRRKKVTRDGVEADRLGDALGTLSAVVFSPSDVAIVTEGPGERRRFLDVLLSLNEEGYLESLQRFRHVLSQRNAALKETSTAGTADAWNPQLVRSGAEVMVARRAWIDAWSESFRDYYAHVSGGRPATMRYRPNVDLDGEGIEEAMGAYREALRDSAESERRMKTTMVGPQRDEVVLSLEDGEGGLDVRDFGSGGQRRTAALALRLVEADTIRERRGHEPLVLLDDAFAELDEARSERILELLEREDTGQVILTAPKESEIRVRREGLPRWTIDGGRIRA